MQEILNMCYQDTETKLPFEEFQKLNEEFEKKSDFIQLVKTIEIAELQFFDFDINRLSEVIENFKLKLNK